MNDNKYFEIESQSIETHDEFVNMLDSLQKARKAGYTHVKDNVGVNLYDEYTIDDAIEHFTPGD